LNEQNSNGYHFVTTGQDMLVLLSWDNQLGSRRQNRRFSCFRRDTREVDTPYCTKEVGEEHVSEMADIANAVYHAAGVGIKTLPILPEKILQVYWEKAILKKI